MARALCEWRAVNVSSLAIGWVSVVKWQSIAQYCRRKPAGGASASFSENSEGSEHSGWLADARDIGGVVVGVDFGLGGNGDLILWLIMRASAKLVSKQKSILVIPLEIYF